MTDYVACWSAILTDHVGDVILKSGFMCDNKANFLKSG